MGLFIIATILNLLYVFHKLKDYFPTFKQLSTVVDTYILNPGFSF